jgi:hypothetical protein
LFRLSGNETTGFLFVIRGCLKTLPQTFHVSNPIGQTSIG